jgi:hypothetical protein
LGYSNIDNYLSIYNYSISPSQVISASMRKTDGIGQRTYGGTGTIMPTIPTRYNNYNGGAWT